MASSEEKIVGPSSFTWSFLFHVQPIVQQRVHKATVWTSRQNQLCERLLLEGAHFF